jgi:hypothetical protein
MCDERDRLIGYLYDECDAGEKRLVEAHLQTCETCREEISGLRGVRTDLLAWDVPDHGSVWTPFVKARPTPSWREVPAWALAAAASLTLLVGAAGGAATTAFLQHEQAGQAVARIGGIAAAVPVSVSQQDLTAMEQRVMSVMRGEMERRVSLVSAHNADGVSDAAVMRRVAELIQKSEQRQFANVTHVSNDLVRVKISTDAEIQELKALFSMQPGR